MHKDYLIEHAASKFRQDNGFTPTESVDVYKLLSKLNVLTVFTELTGNISGMAIKDANSRYMLINAADILARQHFTIGHELYHLFVQENFDNRICKVGLFDKKDKEEYNADWFSSYLLMPGDAILEILPKTEREIDTITLNTIVKMEQYFGVSRTALLNRLKHIDIISPKKQAELKTPGGIKRSALMMGFSETLYEPGNKNRVIGDYGEKAKTLYDLEIVSETDYYNLMQDIGIDLDKTIMEDDKAQG